MKQDSSSKVKMRKMTKLTSFFPLTSKSVGIRVQRRIKAPFYLGVTKDWSKSRDKLRVSDDGLVFYCIVDGEFIGLI